MHFAFRTQSQTWKSMKINVICTVTIRFKLIIYNRNPSAIATLFSHIPTKIACIQNVFIRLSYIQLLYHVYGIHWWYSGWNTARHLTDISCILLHINIKLTFFWHEYIHLVQQLKCMKYLIFYENIMIQIYLLCDAVFYLGIYIMI